MKTFLRTQAGFSLLELSVVLVIVALITSMAVTSGMAVIATSRETATVKKMKAIDDALMAFRIAHDRIPCPASLTLATTDANFGIEGATAGTCTGGTPAANFSVSNTTPVTRVVEGTVPTVTLGLPNDFMYDGWGNRIRYAVDTHMTAALAFVDVPSTALCGGLIIYDSTGVTARTTTAIYALISSGANSHGAYTKDGVIVNAGSTNANEQVNCHCTSSAVANTYTSRYVQQAASLDSTSGLNSFDDIVTYKERWQMRTSWDNYRYVITVDGSWRVQKFTETGLYLSTLTPPAGGSVSGKGAYDATGNLYLPGWDSYVYKFNACNAYVSEFGGLDTNMPDGKFTTWGLKGVTFDPAGNLWATDMYRIQKFTLINNVWTWQASVGSFGTVAPGDSNSNCEGLASPQGTANPTACSNISGDTGCCSPSQSRCSCYYSSYNSGFGNAATVASDSSGNIWAADVNMQRVQKFDNNGKYLLTIKATIANGLCTPGSCSTGTGVGLFSNANPYGVATDSKNNVYITDAYRILKFDSNANWVLTIGNSTRPNSCTECTSTTSCSCNQWGTGALSELQGISVDSNDNVWVGSRYASVPNLLMEYDSNGNLIRYFGTIGNAVGQFASPGPTVVAVSPVMR